MKILIYSANFAPEPTGIGKYSGEMAAWFAEQGHEVRVVSAPPYYPSWKLDEAYRWPLYRREQWNKVTVFRAPIWVPKKPSGLTRILHLATFAISSLPVMLKQIMWEPELVISVAPALMCAPAGWLTAKMSGGKAWLHIQDFEVDVAFEMGLLKGNLLKRIVTSAERKLLKGFDSVSSISGRMMDRLREKGVPEEKLVFFPNWVDINQVKPLVRPLSFRQELRIDFTKKVVLFSGTLGGKQGLMIIPEAAKKLMHREDIMFLVCGNGVMKPQLEAACQGMKNVQFLPLQPSERLNELLSTADIHLLPQSPEAQDLVLPSKMTGMLASGRPIIATCREGTEISSVVSRCGLVVPPEDADTLAQAIMALVDDPESMLRLGILARKYAEENLCRERVLGRLEVEMGRDVELARAVG